MADTHIENDFMERGKPCYTQWKPGNHAALVKTYEFINTDPYCRDVQFALFGGDQLNTGYSRDEAIVPIALAMAIEHWSDER